MQDDNQTNYAAERLRQNWITVLGTRAGRSVVMDILRMCHYGVSPFADNDRITNMISGKQKVAEGVTEMMNTVDASAFFTMLKEAQEDSLNDRASQQRTDEE